MGAPDSLCACRTGTWSRQWTAHPLRWLQQAATRPVPVNNGRIPSQRSEPITLDMTARERAWGSLAHVFLEGLIAADTPEVTDAGDPSSPARRGTVHRGAAAPQASRDVCAAHHGSYGTCRQRGRGPRVALPPPSTPLPLLHLSHDRGHQTCAVCTPRATPRSTRPDVFCHEARTRTRGWPP